MCSQGISQFYLHTHTFIRNRNEPYLPLPSQPQLVLIYRPRRDGRLSRPWCEVAPTEIRTRNLPIAELYHTATNTPKPLYSRCRVCWLTEQRMYWCDGHTERVESADLEGRQRRTLFAGTPDADPFGIAVHGPHVYWTDWAVRGLFRARRDGTGGLERLFNAVFRGLNDVKYFNRTAALGMWHSGSTCHIVPQGRLRRGRRHVRQSVKLFSR